MRLADIKDKIPAQLVETLSADGIDELRPAQEKAIDAGLLDGTHLLVCTPTASGKTLIAEFAAMKGILSGKGRAVYIVPLVALASEKARHFKSRYGKLCTTTMSVGDLDSAEPKLSQSDFIVCTAEKLDSLLRHHAPWLPQVGTIIIDEVHLLNDAERGPTLEVLLTLLRQLLPKAQIIALSATIGNPRALADWLGATLVEDSWRPVTLAKGVYLDDAIHFDEEDEKAKDKKGK